MGNTQINKKLTAKERRALEEEKKAEAVRAAEEAKRLEDEKNERNYTYALRIIFAASLFMAGLYYEIACAVISAALVCVLLWRMKTSGKFTVRLNIAAVAIGLIWLFYLISAFWAVDSGLALWGAAKYLPLPLFALCLLQTGPESRSALLSDIPAAGTVMVILSFTLQYIPAFSSFFNVNGRLAGFFGYPNTFACFLLLGIVVLLTDKNECAYRFYAPVCFAVLLFGLVQAGSRTIYIFSVIAVIACVIVNHSKKTLWFLSAAACAAAAVLIVYFAGNTATAERISTISASSSTLLGRLLYWKDALPVILRHPFGRGYLGYYITQGSFQTGVYSVRWVHNDLLQLLLDVGWIPAIAAVMAAVKALFSKSLNAQSRIIMLVLLAHCMMDFDLEFVSMYFILLLCLSWEAGKTAQAEFSAIVCLPAAAGAIAALLSIWIGISSTLTYAGNDSAAVKVYPWNTLSNASLLTQTDDVNELKELADKIIAQDEYIALAWDAKALWAYAQGNFEFYIDYKKQAISLARYSIEEYEDYFEKLAIGVDLYIEAGDEDSAGICLEEIENIQVMLDELKAQTSALAYEIADTPTFTMPDEYYEYLE